MKEHGLGKRVKLFRGDLFKPLKKKKYDLIITNPPYVDARAMKALPPEYRHGRFLSERAEVLPELAPEIVAFLQPWLDRLGYSMTGNAADASSALYANRLAP